MPLLQNQEIIDITRTLTPSTAVWPGDEPHRRGWTAELTGDSSVNIGRFAQSTHVGTHVDAPLHYEGEGLATHQLDLIAFIGPAVVVAVQDSEPIAPHHLQAVDVGTYPRVLFRTSASARPDEEWNAQFSHLLPETIDHLAELGCVLIGTDAPSVDPADSSELPAHHRLAAHGIVNLENLSLRNAPVGTYELIALPMPLHGMDAAPVRAVLLKAPA